MREPRENTLFKTIYLFYEREKQTDRQTDTNTHTKYFLGD